MMNWIQANVAVFVVIALIVAVLLTVVIFKRRNFGYGRKQAEPSNPDRVRRQNPPD